MRERPEGKKWEKETGLELRATKRILKVQKKINSCVLRLTYSCICAFFRVTMTATIFYWASRILLGRFAIVACCILHKPYLFNLFAVFQERLC